MKKLILAALTGAMVVTAFAYAAALTTNQRTKIKIAFSDEAVMDAVADAADYLDVTDGTAAGSKALVLSSAKTIASITQITAGLYRVTNGTTISGVTDKNLSAAEAHSAQFFLVNTSAPGGSTLDIDFFDDTAPDSADIGARWDFIIVTGGSALTVTAGASGVTTVTTLNTLGSTCEDAGDTISCQLRSTTAATCTRTCAD